jgi:predicted dehydrogenase
MTMKRIDFGIVGGAGWRAEFYLRIAAALPERFRVTGLVVRNADRARAVEAKWGVKAFAAPEEMLRAVKPAFIVMSVPARANAALLRGLAAQGMPVLSETPPAPDVAEMTALRDLILAGAKIQVAEQYPFQPLHAARIGLVASGLLGKVTQAQVSLAHGYHGMVLMRRCLGVMFENVSVTARRFQSPIVGGPGRNGPPATEKIGDSVQEIAWLEFGDKLGVFDFTGDQYFSWVRSPRLLVRGERGEINNEEIRYLVDYLTPVHCRLNRQNAGENGNLEGHYLKGILAGTEWAYRNPFVPGRLTDDEIAIATCLEKMAAYCAGGREFYGLREACQDHYLGLVVKQAIETGQTVRTETQSWAKA